MIVALGFPLNVATIILGCIFSMLLSVFSALGPISNPTPPTAALTEFFHADTVASDQPNPTKLNNASQKLLVWELQVQQFKKLFQQNTLGEHQSKL